MPGNTTTASSAGMMNMICSIVDVKKLEVTDFLRSGAMLAVFLVLMAKGPAKRADLFAVADVVGSAAVGAACYFFPNSYLGYQVDGDLDILHEYLTQIVGAISVGLAWARYRSLETRDAYCSVAFSLIRLLGSSLYLMTMLYAQYCFTGPKKMSPQHFSFAIFGCCIWHLSHAIQLYYYSGEGKRAFGSLGSNRRDFHVLFAALILTLAAMFHWGFPQASLHIIGMKGITLDNIHVHLMRLAAVSVFMEALHFLAALNFETEADKKNIMEGALVITGLALPLMFLYQLKHGMFGMAGFAFTAMAIHSGNLLFGYCEWSCYSWYARVFGYDQKTKK